MLVLGIAPASPTSWDLGPRRCRRDVKLGHETNKHPSRYYKAGKSKTILKQLHGRSPHLKFETQRPFTPGI